MSAYSLNDEIFLTFTKILDEVAFGLVDEDEEINEIIDRNYWETVKGTAKTVKAVDKFIKLISNLMPGCQVKDNIAVKWNCRNSKNQQKSLTLC